MAAACYEKEVVVGAAIHHGHGHHHHHHHHHHHRGNGVIASAVGDVTGQTVLPATSTGLDDAAVIAAAAAAVASASSNSSSSVNANVNAINANSVTTSTAATAAAAAAVAINGYKVQEYKDYSQPLHVDCSVEYELPSQAKPPPGGGEPLLMIHPCYYRSMQKRRETKN